MSLLLLKVLWYPLESRGTEAIGDNVYAKPPINISDLVNTTSNKGLDIKNNIATFTVVNVGGDAGIDDYIDDLGNLKFQEQDQIKIYAKYTEDASDLSEYGNDATVPSNSNELVGVYFIQEIGIEHSLKGTKVNLKCVDKTFVLFNRVWANSYETSEAYTAPTMIQDIIRHVSQNEVGRYPGTGDNEDVQYDIDAKLNDGTEGGQMTSTRSDSTAFPTVEFGLVWKPVYEWIRQLSQPEFNNTTAEKEGTYLYGRPFIFWIDEENVFHWIYPSSTEDKSFLIGDVPSTTLNGNITSSATTITLTDSSDFPSSGTIFIDSEEITYSANDTSTGVLGTVAAPCVRGVNSTTAASHTDTTTVDYESDEIYGVKLKKSIFDVVNMLIFHAGEDMNGTGILDYKFDDTSSAPLKMRYEPMTQIAKDYIRRDYDINTTREGSNFGSGVTGGEPFPQYVTDGSYNVTTVPWSTTAVAYTNDATYNAGLRLGCRNRGKEICSAILARLANARWKGTLQVKGAIHTNGNLINITDTSLGLQDQKVRIMTQRHSFSRNGWFTTLEVEQDVEAITTGA